MRAITRTIETSYGDGGCDSAGAGAGSYSSPGCRTRLNLTRGTPLPPPPPPLPLPFSPADTHRQSLWESLLHNKGFAAPRGLSEHSGHWKVKPFYTNYPPQLVLIWFWSAFLCQDWGLIRSLLSSSTAACLMRWWLDGVRTRPDQDINQSVLVGNPSSPLGNTIFSSINKVWSWVLIRITAVSPPYKSYLVSAAQTNETNRIIKMQIKRGKPRFWLSSRLEEIRGSLYLLTSLLIISVLFVVSANCPQVW